MSCIMRFYQNKGYRIQSENLNVKINSLVLSDQRMTQQSLGTHGASAAASLLNCRIIKWACSQVSAGSLLAKSRGEITSGFEIAPSFVSSFPEIATAAMDF